MTPKPRKTRALQEGDMAPDVTLPDGEGKPVRLASFRGRSVVLYFYPKDQTPGCTKEACDFRDKLPTLKEAGAVVFGVSHDAPESHQRFAKKERLTFPLLSDQAKRVTAAYGVYKEKQFMGRRFMGIERTTFVIDRAGRIAKIFPKVQVNGHVTDVLDAVKALREHGRVSVRAHPV